MVRFLLLRSLTDERPNVVESEHRFAYSIPGNLTAITVVLHKETNRHEILWYFSHHKGSQRVTLKQNPHFYTELPRSASGYSDTFTADPILSDHVFWDATEILVLTHERSRVFLETDRRQVYNNFWVLDEVIIFQGPHVVLLISDLSALSGSKWT